MVSKKMFPLILFIFIPLTSGCSIRSTPPGANLNYYFGQFHSHTSYSDGEGTPEEAFTCARDDGHADFFAVTDHSNYFDNDLDWRNSHDWARLKQIADDFNEDNRFVAIAGFEMTWNANTDHWGHINTFNTDWFESRTNPDMDLLAYYEKLLSNPFSFSQWNHPGPKFGDFADFAFYNANRDKAMKLIEVGNGDGAPGTDGYHPSYAYYTRALDKGWHVAPSNNQDNHYGKWITANDCRTVVLAPALTRKDIYNGVKNLKVYATEDKNLKLSFSINGFLMGTILRRPKTLKIEASAEDSDMFDSISRLDLIADGGAIAASQEFDSTNVNWAIELDATYKYYYLKTTEADGDIAVTAPIWTGN